MSDSKKKNESTRLTPSNLFYTPKTTSELMEMLEGLSDRERAVATQYAMHAWNLACHLTNEN